MDKSNLNGLSEIVWNFLSDDRLSIMDRPKEQLYKQLGSLDEAEIKNRIRILRKLMYLTLETKYTNEETKMYIRNKYMSYSDVNKEINKSKGQNEKPANPATTRNKIYLTAAKMNKDNIGKEMLRQLLGYKGLDVVNYELTLESLIRKYTTVATIADKLVINNKLPKNIELVKNMDSDGFDESLKLLTRYTNRIFEKRKAILLEVIGYIDFLNNTEDSLLTSEQLSHKQLAKNKIL